MRARHVGRRRFPCGTNRQVGSGGIVVRGFDVEDLDRLSETGWRDIFPSRARIARDIHQPVARASPDLTVLHRGRRQ